MLDGIFVTTWEKAMGNMLAGPFWPLCNAKIALHWTRNVLDPQGVVGGLIFICLFQHTLIYKGSVWLNLRLVEQKIITQSLTKSNFHKGAA